MNLNLAFAALAVLAASSLAGCSGSPTEEDETEDVEGALADKSKQLFSLPSYFALPKNGLAPIPANDARTLPTVFWTPSNQTESMGLRVVPMAGSAEAGRLVAERGRDGLIRPGDVLVVFHREYADTLPLLHLTMGTTANVEVAGRVPLQSWLDNKQSPVDAFHVLRPRALSSPEAQQKVDSWISLARQTTPSEHWRSVFGQTKLATAEQLTTFGRALVNGTAMTTYSRAETAFGVIALAGCTPADLQAPSPAAACIRLPFAAQMYVAESAAGGYLEGPLLSARAAGVAPDLNAIFSSRDNERLRDTITSLADLLKPALPMVRTTYEKRTRLDTAVNLGDLRSPTSMTPSSLLVEALQPTDRRALDYVATVTIDQATMTKAREIAKQTTR